MTEAARDLYLLLAALGLMPAIALARMPVLAGSAFVAAGAVGAAQFERLGLPIGTSVLLAILLGATLGALTGVLVGRADQARTALATWALAWLAFTALLVFPDLSGGDQGLTRPAVDRVETFFGATLTLTPTVHLVTAALLCALALAALHRLRAAPLGLDAVAIGGHAELARSLGVPVGPRRAALLAIAGAAGATAGAGVALVLGVAAPADLSPLLALQLLAAVIVGGAHPIAGPLLAAVVIAAIPRLADVVTDTGVVTAALLVACVLARNRVPQPLPPERETAPATPPAPRGRLAVRDVHCRLGGAAILRGVDLEVPSGQIHALIGPNGSGKTTLLRVIAGALPAQRGAVRAEGGVVRTFQQPADFPGLSATQQLAVAARHRDVPAPEGPLPVARAVATGAAVLALDEPAADLSTPEREELTALLRRLADEGRAVLVVEHDLRFVAGTADVVTVIDEGVVVARGTPAEVVQDEAVRRVYLGAA
jgi:ABC-type branched-subunit amino acid transport system ATPase component/ABC-type branched-subunit amino acid transport system permease subunit